MIDVKIGACRDGLRSIVIPMESRVSKISMKMSEHDEQMGRFRNEVANILKLRESMHDIADGADEVKCAIKSHDN